MTRFETCYGICRLGGLLLILSLLFPRCGEKQQTGTFNQAEEQHKVGLLLDSFNVAAAKADYQGYFNFYAEDAIFTGTDATERWNKKAFMDWAKPYFNKGKAWSFTSLQRNIYFDKTGNIGWFDELLDTRMKLCRGSGVLVKEGTTWKIQQYILSAMVPNNLMDTVIHFKSAQEDSLVRILKR